MNIEWLRKNFEKQRFRVYTRTASYIAPCLKIHKDLVLLLNQFYSTAVGLEDIDSPIDGVNLYFLLNIERKNKMKAAQLLAMLRNHVAYNCDYPFGDLLYDKLHMLVLKVPEQYHLDVVNFKMGRYSQLFKNDRDILFNKDSVAYRVITKDPLLEAEINYNLGGVGQELDQAPVLNEEVFNHKDFNPDRHSIVWSNNISKLNWL